MTNRNVTARHVRHALRLLVTGATHDVDQASGGTDQEAKDNAGWVLDELGEELAEVANELAEHGGPRTDIKRAWDMVTEMETMVKGPTCPPEIGALLAKHGFDAS